MYACGCVRKCVFSNCFTCVSAVVLGEMKDVWMTVSLVGRWVEKMVARWVLSLVLSLVEKMAEPMAEKEIAVKANIDHLHSEYKFVTKRILYFNIANSR